MLENLHIAPEYEGFLFLAESGRNPPRLHAHHHVELELNLVAEGSVTYVVQGKRYTFNKRSLIWFFPSQEHQLVDRSADAAYYVATFTPEMIQQTCKGTRYAPLKQKKLSNEGVIHAQLQPDVFEATRGRMADLVKDGLDPDLLNREAGFGLTEGFRFRHEDPDYLNAGLRHLLLRCWRYQEAHTQSSHEVILHRCVRQVLDLLADEDCDESIDALARTCGVSAAHLSRTFRSEIGVTLSRYRNSLRLSRFWKAYRSPNTETVLEAALAAGFGSYAQFYRVFAEAYGSGPREML
jgi:methylphosphotriester-DNA--protein-cysteine methyltransferase